MIGAPRPLLLASTSSARHALLSRLGVPFETASPRYEEGPRPGLTPAELASTHARGKALSLAAEWSDHLILGSDSVLVLGDEVLGKPGSEERAVAQLLRMAGQTCELITAVSIHEPRTGRTESGLASQRLTVRPLLRERLARYVARDQPLWCAGSFKLESLGISLFSHIEGSDYTGTIGLPLITVVALLERFGIEIP